nr:hypothetical protein [Mammaliicoccus sp. Marseille-Q6498]
MKWFYGLLTVCLLFLVACDDQTSKKNDTDNKEKSAETKTTETNNSKDNSSEEKAKTNKTTENKTEQNANNEKQAQKEIPVEENVNEVRLKKYERDRNIDAEKYTVSRNCLLNKGNSQAECDRVENTVEFTRAWQNLSNDGYLCNDDGCSQSTDEQPTNQDGNQQQPNKHNNQQTGETPNNQNQQPKPTETNNGNHQSTTTSEQPTNEEGNQQQSSEQNQSNQAGQENENNQTITKEAS